MIIYLMKKIFFSFLFLLCFFWVYAQDFLDLDPTWYVNDYANILTVDEEMLLEQQLQTYQKETTHEMSIVTLSDLEWYDVAFAATQLLRSWWVWSSNDNWIVILIAPGDRKRFITVWYGLEWVLPDATAKIIGEQILPPAFKEEKYYQWLASLVQKLSDVLAGEVFETTTDLQESDWFTTIIMILLFLAPFFWAYIKKWLKKKQKAKEKTAIDHQVFGWIWTWGVGLLSFLLLSSWLAPFLTFLTAIILFAGESKWWGSSTSTRWWSSSSFWWSSSSSSFGWFWWWSWWWWWAGGSR